LKAEMPRRLACVSRGYWALSPQKLGAQPNFFFKSSSDGVGLCDLPRGFVELGLNWLTEDRYLGSALFAD
jgi:hypothetical protein